jgi:hypothetical protein
MPLFIFQPVPATRLRIGACPPSLIQVIVQGNANQVEIRYFRESKEHKNQ